MEHIIWFILYGPFDIDHMIWIIENGKSNMESIIHVDI